MSLLTHQHLSLALLVHIRILLSFQVHVLLCLCVLMLQLLLSPFLLFVGVANPSCVMHSLCAFYDIWSRETGTRGQAFKYIDFVGHFAPALN